MQTVINQSRFGRLPSLKPQRAHYLATSMLMRDIGTTNPFAALDAGLIPSDKYYWCPPALHQGETPRCVAYAAGQMIEMGPVVQNIFNKSNEYSYLETMYNEMQAIDEWNYMPHDGTSVDAGMRVLRNRNHIVSFHWGNDADDVFMWILSGKGPVQIGIAWNEGMLTTNSEGFIKPTGQVIGGHSCLIIGADMEKRYGGFGFRGKKPALRGMNSWGTGWGQRGRFWISYDDFALAMSNYGEAAMSTEIKGSVERLTPGMFV